MKWISAILMSAVLCISGLSASALRSVTEWPDRVYAEENGQEAEQEQPTEQQSDGETAETPMMVLSAPSAILMEVSTGQIIYEQESHQKLPPASVTKVMTLLLIFDAIDSGKLSLEDTVTTSEYAASMGGSQVFLEAGETQTVDTMIKCIAVASANDACVAMAEQIAGSEEEFVRMMNERAQGLGMQDTCFKNCNGLDTDGHETTAYDIALMSRELITKYPQIHEYSMIWMENITHTTKKGTSEFGLTNTNKLIRQYQYATGLKTGSTSKARFCVSATAKKDDLELIAVVMAAPDSKARVKDAITMFQYGFGKCTKYVDTDGLKNAVSIKVSGGKEEAVAGEVTEPFCYVDTSGKDVSRMEKKLVLKEKVKAPVKKGDTLGCITYSLEGTVIGEVPVTAKKSVQKMNYAEALKRAAKALLAV